MKAGLESGWDGWWASADHTLSFSPPQVLEGCASDHQGSCRGLPGDHLTWLLNSYLPVASPVMKQIPKQGPGFSMGIKGTESAHMLSVAKEGWGELTVI